MQFTLRRLLDFYAGSEDPELVDNLTNEHSHASQLAASLAVAARAAIGGSPTAAPVGVYGPALAGKTSLADLLRPGAPRTMFSKVPLIAEADLHPPEALKAGIAAAEEEWRQATVFNRGAAALKLAELLYRARRYRESLDLLEQVEAHRLGAEERRRLNELKRHAQMAIEAVGFLHDVRERVVRMNTRKLRGLIGTFLERFGATSAWLFLKCGDQLVSVIEQNAGIKGINLAIGEGIVGHVAATGKAYLAFDLHLGFDPHYVELVAQTKSELAVPIINRATGELLGVLNLEARANYAFSESSTWELEELASGLVPYLLVLQKADASCASLVGCYFNRRNWGIADILTDFCYHLCDVMERYGPRPSCTIWQLDEAKSELWAKATDGYDFEYIAVGPLPADAKTAFIGRVLRSPRGAVVRDHWSNLNVYMRRDKARRMGVSRVIATPIHRPTRGECFGVLNFYFFFEEQELADTLVQHISDALGELVESHEELQPLVAGAHFSQQLARRKSLSTETTISLILHMLLKNLNADTGSIFVRRDGANDFYCIATTGLEENGERVTDPTRAVYTVDAGSEGLTPFLANHPGVCVRKNDVPSHEEPVEIQVDNEVRSETIWPRNRYRETFAVSETEHRRFLGYSVPDPQSGESIAVIRLLRTPQSRPFIPSDEVLLRECVAASEHVFDEWLHERRYDSYAQAVRQRLLGREAIPPVIEKAFYRLIRPVTADFGWSSSLVDEVLQHTLTFFGSQGALHASLREVARAPDGGEHLRLFHFHSTRSSAPPDQNMFPPVTRRESSIGWQCIEDWKILTFVRKQCEPLFKPIHRDSTRVQSGVVIPIVTWTGGRCVKWVLSVDFTQIVDWDAKLVEFLLHVSRKLSAILSDSAPPVYLPTVTFLKGFVASGVEATKADWGTLELTRRGRNRTTSVVHFATRKSAPGTSWSALSGSVGEFGVKVSEDGGACRIPLLFGPFEAGHLTCGSTTKNYTEQDIELGRIVRLWSSLAGFPGRGDGSIWVSEFRSVPHDIDGIVAWEARPEWNPTAELSSALEEPLNATRQDAICFQSV